MVVFCSLPLGETFSENWSHTEKCRPCTVCTGLFRMKAPCTDSNDATCVCNYGFYLNEFSQQCEPCTKCPVGQGMLYSCEYNQDTVCEECTADTYSDQENSREPCIPCTTCEDGEVLQQCTSVSDTACLGKTIAHILIVMSVPRHSVLVVSLYITVFGNSVFKSWHSTPFKIRNLGPSPLFSLCCSAVSRDS